MHTKVLGEEQPGGLVIVRASSARPPYSQEARPTQAEAQPQPRHSSVPPPSRHVPNGDLPNGNRIGQPSKKFKAGSSILDGMADKGKARELATVAEADEAADEDVRHMQSEVDALRRKSRAAEAATANVSTAFQFPPPGPSSKPPKPTQQRGRIRETSQPLPLHETPQQERNRLLRGEFSHRRKSSLTRGKRISSTYHSTGVIGASAVDRVGFPVIRPAHKDSAQPHTSVRSHSFCKHIDVELPEPQRAQQLLIWCSHRASNEAAESNAQGPSSRRSAKDPGKDPPPLPDEYAQLLKGVGEDLVRMLAESQIDTNVYSLPADEDRPKQLKPNEQNVRNKEREVRFNAQIQRYVTR
jgi:kinetochore protein Mis13/DSN1